MRASIWLLLVLLPACRREPPKPAAPSADSPIVATVGDTTITARQLTELIARQSPAIRAHYSSVARRKDLLDNEIRFELLAAEARKRGYERDPEFVRAVKQQLVSTFLHKEIEAKLKPEDISEQEIEAYYRTHIDQFMQPELVRVSQIVVKDRSKARVVLRTVKGLGPDDVAGFARLVAETSEDANSKVRGGDLGFIEKNRTTHPAPLVEAAFTLKAPGEVAGPVQTEQGFHILRLLEKRPGSSRTFDDAKLEIRQRLYQQQRAKRMDSLLADIKKQTKVEVREAELAQVSVESSKP